MSSVDIAVWVELSREAIGRIRRRFVQEGVEGLADRPKAGRKDHAVAAATVERVVQLALSPPPAGRSRWTTRLLGREVWLTSGCVSDLLRAQGMKPHLTRTYKVSRDPQFADKVTDVVGLYLNPPDHAIVLCVDEKTSIQALQRTQPPLPLRAGRAVRHTHDYPTAWRRRSVCGARGRDRSGHPSFQQHPYRVGLPVLHEQGRPRLSGPSAPRHSRQLVDPQYAGCA